MKQVLRCFYSLILIGFSVICVYAQQPPLGRYTSELFSSVIETNDIQFSTAVPQPNEGGGFYEFITGYPLNVEEYNTSPVNLKMDIFEPAGDTLTERPLVIVCFGGGFLGGSKDHWSIRLLCQNLAKRGFVAAAIDYRLGMNIFDSDLALRAVYRGIQDGRSAVRYFRNDVNGANTYKVDPDKIFIGGHSAGAFIALHNIFMEEETERPISTYNWLQDGQSIPDQGCLDCVGDNLTESGLANGVFSLAGALGFTDFIQSPTDSEMVMFHSLDDDTVPYYSGEPFGSLLFLVVGSDLPDVFGSDSIATRADLVGLNYEFHPYGTRGHNVHEETTASLYNDIMPKISDWFYLYELKPLIDTIHGQSILCSDDLSSAYQIDSEGGGVYYDWQVQGGTFMSMSNYSNNVEILWDINAAERIVQVVAWNSLDAISDTLVKSINIQTSAINHFVATTNEWMDPNNWGLLRIPEFCDEVNILDLGLVDTLILDNVTHFNRLELGQNMTLKLLAGSELHVKQKQDNISSFAASIDGIIMNSGLIRVSSSTVGKEIEVIGGTIINISTSTLLIGN